MTDSTLTRVLSGLEEIASRLKGASAEGHEHARRADVDPPHSYVLGYVEVKIDSAVEDLRKDIKLLRDNLSLGGDTDGTSPD